MMCEMCENEHFFQQEVVHTTASSLPLKRSPRLLMTVRCHLNAIRSIVYVNKRQLIVTGAKDATARLWTDRGRYIGTFGQPQRWNFKPTMKVKY